MKIKNRSFFFTSTIIIISFLLFSANKCRDTFKKTDTRSYMLAFSEAGTNKIRVRWSKDGNVWKSSNFRNATTYIGVGTGVDPAGILRIIPYITPENTVNFVWGIGAIFEQNNFLSTSQIATSAPSAVYGNNKNYWYIAYRISGNTIALRTYNTANRHLLDRNDAPIDNAFNDHVGSRPALCRLGNKLIMAWERLTNIQFAVADISTENLTWTNKYTLNVSDHFGLSYYSTFLGDPTLTHDNSKFYMGIMRRTRPGPDSVGEFLVRTDLIIYSSSDGITWTNYASKLQIPVRAIVNIAARDDGTILAAVIGDNTYAIYRYKNGGWTELNKQSVFNWVPAKRQFGFVSMGYAPRQN